MSNPIHELQELDQAVWLDSIRRSYLREGGYLPQLLEAGELNGLASNPTIFQKALDAEDDYDEQLRELEGSDPRDAFWTIMKTDVGDACDLFRPLYDSSDGLHGLVSIEVDPSKAFDTEETVSEALLLYRELDRPNLMVKVPGTEPGLGAITRLIAEGVNVNVTLLFSVPRYEAVIEAYMEGLRRRAEQNEDLASIRSVASFFVSRVDSMVADRVDADLPQMATAGIANARVAYGSFERVFGGSEFAELADAGANVQRPLWASTSTKDPDLPKTLYVEQLAGPQTVNTMPEETLDAIREEADVADRISGAAGEAAQQLQRLSEQGLDLEQVTKELESEGVEKFVNSFDEAVETVARKLS
ncbi:MAG: transaldolase [Egibacteraceae bacterium]